MAWSSATSHWTLLLVIISLCMRYPVNAHAHAHHGAHHRHIGHWRLAGRDLPASALSTLDLSQPATPCVGPNCVGAYPISQNQPCVATNGTTLIAGSNSNAWTILCDTDFFEQDIYPFILAATFNECLDHCDQYNTNNNGGCAGFVFAPDRVRFENSCYLKSSVDNIIYPSTIHLVGATLLPKQPASTVSVSPVTPTKVAGLVVYESATSKEKVVPEVVEAKALAVSRNDPATQYVVHEPFVPQKLIADMVEPGINLDLVTKYPLAADTGSWTTASAPLQLKLANMTLTPRMSRDGGRGGNINGTHVFMFCDTSTFGNEETAMGYMNGFVSSSAALSANSDPLGMDRLVLKDTVGQWQDDVGRLRGWIEMTTGEQAFNVEISGDGYRYAVWPDSSFIPYNTSHALMYAPVVYVEVNMTTQAAVFKSLGNTLILIHIDAQFGPHADRVKTLMFKDPEVEWGSLGGLRAWSASGNGTMDGSIYLFGAVDHGILAAKVAPSLIVDRDSYQYWNGTGWSSEMQTRDSTAYLIDQPVMNFDIFYSPYFATFFMVYLTPHADNTFYYRWLMVDTPVIPPYEQGSNDENYCDRIFHEKWSEPKILWQADTPEIGYIYAGGAHMGFFGAQDITNGGNYLLISWTEHTKVDPEDAASGYAHKSARVKIFHRK